MPFWHKCFADEPDCLRNQLELTFPGTRKHRQQEHAMARFDPNTYPDRLDFEAAARRMRVDEFDRLFGAAAAWLEARQRKLARQFGAFGAVISTHSHRRLPH
jgi:hypothetical protein